MQMGSVSISVLALVWVWLQVSILPFQLAGAAALVRFSRDTEKNFIRVSNPPLSDEAQWYHESSIVWTSRTDGGASSAWGSGANEDATATRYLYGRPVQFREPTFNFSQRRQGNDTVSFSTTFAIGFTKNSLDFGSFRYDRSDISFEGAAFIITPDAYTVGAGGGSLGLADTDVGASPSTSMSHTVAVELDMVRNPEFGDPEGVHIGIDVGNMTSLSVAPVGEDVYNRTQPYNWVQLWIEYHNPTRSLEIRISNWMNGSRPLEPSLVREIDLSKLVLDDMYVGFSAALRSCKEDYANSTNHTCARSVNLLGWRFQTFDKHSMASPVTDSFTVSFPGGFYLGPGTLRVIKAASVVAALAFLAGLGLAFYFWWDGLVWSGTPLERRRWRFDVDADIDAGPHKFSYRELSLATRGFSADRTLGRGGFGSVYKGFLPGNRVEVAVKRVAHDSKQGEKEFLAEINIIGKIRHRNLVRLQGWCHKGGQLLLVYDYLPGGSLDRLLFRDNQPDAAGPPPDIDSPFTWEKRSKAFRGVAAAVAYLHDECDERILHRDIKASNVMLDAKFNAKLGDFGLARAYQHSMVAPESTVVAGTFGYLAPELFRSGKATQKSDVYSFGVFLLEVACGRRPIEPRLPVEQVLLVDWVWELFAEAKVLDAADPKLFGDFDAQEMTMVVSLALLCCHPDPDARPSMRQVVMILGRDKPLPTVPQFRPEAVSGNRPLTLEDLTSASSSYLQDVDNSDLRGKLSASSSTNYSRVKSMEVITVY